MKMRLKYNLLLLALAVGLQVFSQLSVKPGDKNISYMGRVAISTDSTSMFWPGSSATLRFKGSAVNVVMKSFQEPAYFYAILDGDASKALKFAVDSERKTIQLATGIPNGEHTLLLYKLSNCTSENRIYSFQIDGKAALLSPAKFPARKIEFYGNSITAGHGVDVPNGMNDSGKPEYFNNYFTYAALTARHYNAQYSCVARSGIGVMVSWFPEIMPEVYNRLNPADSTSKWDFTKFTPDVVVINLFQNDSWLVTHPEHPQFKARFGETKPTDAFIVNSYRSFLSTIRSKYPNAQIICALGNMDATRQGSKWPGYIQQAVNALNDAKIYTIVFPYKNSSGHPKKPEQQAMADQLIQFIDKNIKW